MHSLRYIPLLLLMLGLYACTRSGVGFEVSLETDTLAMYVGETRSIQVSVNRTHLATDAVIDLTLNNPPAGLSVTGLQIAGTSGTLSLTASKAGDYTLELVASAGEVSKTLPLQIRVSGRFQISADPGSIKMLPQQKAQVALSVKRLGLENTAPITISLENPPPGVTAQPVTLTGDTGMLELSASLPGIYTLDFLASAGQYTQKLSLNLEVTNPSGFGLSVEPSRRDLNIGDSASVQISLQREGGFGEAVTISLTDLPSGVSATDLTIAANQTQGLMTLTASSTATPGLSAVRVRASSTGATQTTTFMLNVRQITQDIKKETIATNLSVPWDLSFAPNGVLYFTERSGNIKKVLDGVVTSLSHPLKVHQETEAGLMGMVFDPEYPDKPYIYVCYSYLDNGIKNRVSRLTLQADTLRDETFLIDAIPGSTNHDGCRMTFGPDKKLYITTGDARLGGNAQDLNSMAGKVLRINDDGSIPSDNPFGSAIWSYGHRNAQGITFHADGRLYSSEHGDASEDEVNRIVSGGNYGWPYIEGRCNTTTEQTYCANTDFQEPLTVYMPTLGVSGLSSYDKDMFPEWRGNLLLASLKAGQLYRIVLDAQGRAVDEELLINYDYGRLRDVEVAPDGSIYIAISNRDGRGINPFPKTEDDQIIRWYR